LKLWHYNVILCQYFMSILQYCFVKIFCVHILIYTYYVSDVDCSSVRIIISVRRKKFLAKYQSPWRGVYIATAAVVYYNIAEYHYFIERMCRHVCFISLTSFVFYVWLKPIFKFRNTFISKNARKPIVISNTFRSVGQGCRFTIYRQLSISKILWQLQHIIVMKESQSTIF